MHKKVAILHGAGYTGGELIRLILHHPVFELDAVTSRSYEGQPVWNAHPSLRGQTDLEFSASESLDLHTIEAILVAAEHGQGATAVQSLLDAGYQGSIVDLSADFRFRDADIYPARFGFEHPAPHLLDHFIYGLSEVSDADFRAERFIANPGCFATAISLALWPLSNSLTGSDVSVTALTGASGSGVRPKDTTHFPTREGNVRAYKVFTHQHQPEIEQVLGGRLHLRFVPASGPWTRGIWGTALVRLPGNVEESAVTGWYQSAYGHRQLVRLWPGTLPELRFSVNTPYCDLGWAVSGSDLVIGFALDNLLKGAASQAVQNLNLVYGLVEGMGLVPESEKAITA